MGVVDATFMARDADAGDNARLLYTIKVLISIIQRLMVIETFEMLQLTTGGDHFQMETSNYSIADTSKVGKLRIIKELNYEEQTFYILTITVQVRPYLDIKFRRNGQCLKCQFGTGHCRAAPHLEHPGRFECDRSERPAAGMDPNSARIPHE